MGLGKVNAAKYRYTPEVIVLPRLLLAYLRGVIGSSLPGTWLSMFTGRYGNEIHQPVPHTNLHQAYAGKPLSAPPPDAGIM